MYIRKKALIYPFFAVNLERRGYWIKNPDVKERYEAMVETVYDRHQKLTEAFEIATSVPSRYPMEQEEAFSEYAAELFKRNPEYFDELTAKEIAAAVVSNYDGRILEERIDWVGARPLYDTRFVKTKDWELLRNVGIGGSETPTVQGVNPYECERGLHHRKIGTPMADELGAALDRGHKIEPDIYDWICELKGFIKVPEFRMMQSLEFPNCTGNFDGIMRKMGTEDYWLFEAKTASANHHSDWAGKRIPQNYLCQVNHYCGVLADDRIKGKIICCFFFVNEFEEDAVTGNKKYWFGGAVIDKIYREIPRDIEAERKILEDAQNFWENYIDFGIEPENSFSPAEMKLVEKVRAAAEISSDVFEIDLSDKDNATLRDAVNAYKKADDAYKAASAEANKAKKLRDAYAPEIIKALDNHDRASLIGGKKPVKVSYISQKSTRSADWVKLSTYYADAYEACVTSKPNKPSLSVEVIDG